MDILKLMIKEITLRLSPEKSSNTEIIREEISNFLGLNSEEITDFLIEKRSIDARQKKILYNLKIKVGLEGEFVTTEQDTPKTTDCSNSESVIIVGSGPAGLFAALRLIENGLKPIIIERGKNVRDRRRDLVEITRNHKVNEDSNYCFGEGGAGTYSDGKLYTRSGNKKTNQRDIGNLREIWC